MGDCIQGPPPPAWDPYVWGFCPCLSAYDRVEMTLKNTSIERCKDRVTIDATYAVDRAHAVANPPSKDGDLHIAGRAPEIGLAIVADRKAGSNTKITTAPGV